ncbi:MAG: hydrogenase nickel incorporation protein HypA [Opitutaceae bacterium]|nr:hydrogenase nickel incorporation protein HypA [Opitutaceae bacterium]
MDLTLGAVAYCLLALGFFFGVWLYYDRRDHALYDAERRKVTLHCIRCGHLYSAKTGTETAACPRCGHANARLKF